LNNQILLIGIVSDSDEVVNVLPTVVKTL
jgi:hypothetical protein